MSTLQSDSASSLFIGTAREQGETENDWKKVVANVTVGATELSETGTNTATTLYTDTIVTADDYLCIDNGTDTLIRAKADSVSSTGDTWDVSGASYYNKYFSIGSQDTTLRGSFFKPDGSKLYIVGYSSKTIYQYSLSTATVDITSQALSSAPDAVYLAPEPSTVKTCLATSADRCLCKDITLTKLSSTTTEFIGKVAYDSADFAIAGENLLASGDVVNVTVGGVELEVVVSGVSAVVTTETDITYTITFPAQSAAPTALTIPDRSEAATFSSRSWDATSGIVLTYVPQYALDARGVQYRIDGTEDCNVTKVKLDLWRS